MLLPIADDIWHAQHAFTTYGVSASSRMTVVRLGDGALWLHSPIPLTDGIRAALAALGPVAYIVAPSKMHHMFVGDYVAAYPQAALFGAPGLAKKRPDLATMRKLSRTGVEPEWRDDLDQVFFDGIPAGNETVWLHKSSATLIVTDLLQWWPGDRRAMQRLYANLAGVRRYPAVPRTIRLLIKDRPAARAAADRILAWPFGRVVVAHDTTVENDAHAAVERAFRCFD